MADESEMNAPHGRAGHDESACVGCVLSGMMDRRYGMQGVTGAQLLEFVCEVSAVVGRIVGVAGPKGVPMEGAVVGCFIASAALMRDEMGGMAEHLAGKTGKFNN